MMYWYGNGMSGWGFALMTLSTIVFWGLVIFGVFVLVRGVSRSSAGRRFGSTGRSTPEELLAERFARGEIDEDEYHRRLDTLRRDLDMSSTNRDQYP
ncbi:SHOCT domain-containing protein [Amycolatopsis sp. RM579]|uniref:SHOCT domain-containing protein n=2 Tax=Amycolatopsis pithecellobii TaxID=664692 RepID=A0A6N7ZBN9_9PSEU|nr:SHOCT domain-containing protein [Amycolatopsis pithecellobii]